MPVDGSVNHPFTDSHNTQRHEYSGWPVTTGHRPRQWGDFPQQSLSQVPTLQPPALESTPATRSFSLDPHLGSFTHTRSLPQAPTAPAVSLSKPDKKEGCETQSSIKLTGLRSALRIVLSIKEVAL